MARNALAMALTVHRYLGLVLSAIFLMWCVSGVVMMYVPYPALDEGTRIRGLEPLDLSACCHLPAEWASKRLRFFRLEMFGRVPVALLVEEGGQHQVLLDLQAAREIRALFSGEMYAVAALFGQSRGYEGRPRLEGSTSGDQWTVEGHFWRFAPLFKFSWPDTRQPMLYVSSRTGEAVQLTEQPQRLWNWIGSIPHWFYFYSLRRNPAIWSQVVIWSSIAGALLVAIGFYLGCVQLLRMRRRGRASSYRGLRFLHHIPGLIFGIFLLTWVVSGGLSMNPWGLMEDNEPMHELSRLAGTGPTGFEVIQALDSMDRGLLHLGVSLQLSTLNSHAYFVLVGGNGEKRRLDVQGRSSPIQETDIAFIRASLLESGAGTESALTSGDAYYFTHGRSHASFPVYRLLNGGSDKTRYYVDPLDGHIIRRFNASARQYRWWFEGLHRWDFMRQSPLRDVLVLAVLSGMALTSGTGLLLGVRWLRRKTKC